MNESLPVTLVIDAGTTPDMNSAVDAESTLVTEIVPDAWPAEMTIAGYEIDRELARGGMGRVFAGRELALNREVAIKTMLPGAPIDRFLIESRITARLPHPGIPPVYALGTLGSGMPFLVMKLVRGQTLADALKTREPDGILRYLPIFEAICQAVGFAHANEVVHRDLKPHNIMTGAFGEVQVMDWGLARSDAADPDRRSDGAPPLDPPSKHIDINPLSSVSFQTREGTIVGTPAYMAPEQARGERVDARADVFALGGILCTIMTGQPPFVGDTIVQTLMQASTGDTTDALARIAACGADLEVIAIARQCLAVDVDARPADGRAVAMLVADYRNRLDARLRVAETARATLLLRVAEQRKRRRLFQWSTTIVAAVLVLGIVGTSLGLIQARHAKDEVEAKNVKIEETLNVVSQRTSLAMDAYDELVFGTQTTLETRPGTQEYRKVLLIVARSGLSKILAAARKQGTPDSTYVWTHYRMGDVEKALGNTEAAQAEYEAGHTMAVGLAAADPANARAQRDLSLGYSRLGTIELSRGRVDAALDNFDRSLAIAERLYSTATDNVQLQRDVLVAYDRLGDVNIEKGQTEIAGSYYQKGFEIRRRLAAADPTHTQTQRDLGISHIKVGDAMLRRGSFAIARDHYRDAATILQPVADRDPLNVPVIRDLSTSYQKWADMLVHLGQSLPALEIYRKSLAIDRQQAGSDPKNVQVQRDLCVTYNRLGAIWLQQGQPAEAGEFFQSGLAISLRLAEADPKNADLQHDLSYSYVKLGEFHLRTGKTGIARENLLKALAIDRRNVAIDPNNRSAQRDLSISYDKLGEVSNELGEAEVAADYYRRSLALALQLADIDANDAQAQRDLSVGYSKLGDIYRQLDQTKEALDQYQSAIAILKRLASLDAKSALGQRDLFVLYNKLGAVSLQMTQVNEAIGYYELALAMCVRLAAADPTNDDAQRDLFVSYIKLGDVIFQLNHIDDAETLYNKALDLAQRRTADQNNLDSQRILSIAYNKVADALVQRKAFVDALAIYQKALVIDRQLAAIDSTNATAQRDLLICLFKIGNVAETAEDYVTAISWYEKSLAVAAKFPPATFVNEIKVVRGQIANCQTNLSQREPAPPPRPSR